MQNSDEWNDFHQEMKGVQKIKQDKIIETPNSSLDRNSSQYRQNAAQRKDTRFENYLTDGEVEMLDPNELLSFKISGIQPNVFKNLKAAKYSFDFQLDLHGLTVSQARDAVFRLIKSGNLESNRCFLIVHGKGERSKQPAKLKSYVNHWLKQIDLVIAFHSALDRHGGAGAVYVLLKKPKPEKRINHEKYI